MTAAGAEHTNISHPLPQSHLWEVGFGELQEGTCTAPSVENVGANAKSSRAGCVTIRQKKNVKRLVCKFSCGQEAFPYFFISLFIFKMRFQGIGEEDSEPSHSFLSV